MKKLISILVVSILFSGIAYASVVKTKEAFVKDNYEVVLNGEKVNIENSIVTIDGNSYIPLREFSNMLELNVEFFEGVIEIKDNEIKRDEEKNIEDVIREDKTLQISENELRIRELELMLEIVNTNIEKRLSNNLSVDEALSAKQQIENDIMYLEELNVKIREELGVE